MYKINSSSQKILEKMLGKKYREIVDMDYDDEISYIQNCPEDVLKQWIK